MSDNNLSSYEEFIKSLYDKINELYKEQEIEPTTDDLPTMFGNLITGLSKKHKERVVILIDEYEAPILEPLNNKEEAEKVRRFLREFYKK